MPGEAKAYADDDEDEVRGGPSVSRVRADGRRACARRARGGGGRPQKAHAGLAQCRAPQEEKVAPPRGGAKPRLAFQEDDEDGDSQEDDDDEGEEDESEDGEEEDLVRRVGRRARG